MSEKSNSDDQSTEQDKTEEMRSIACDLRDEFEGLDDKYDDSRIPKFSVSSAGIISSPRDVKVEWHEMYGLDPEEPVLMVYLPKTGMDRLEIEESLRDEPLYELEQNDVGMLGGVECDEKWFKLR